MTDREKERVRVSWQRKGMVCVALGTGMAVLAAAVVLPGAFLPIGLFVLSVGFIYLYMYTWD